MILGYKVYSDVTAARAQANALWVQYSTNERMIRGLPAGASLDLRAGERVEPPITIRYQVIITANGETRACMVIDSFAESLHNQNIEGTVVNTMGYVDVDSLPPRLRDVIRSPLQSPAGIR